MEPLNGAPEKVGQEYIEYCAKMSRGKRHFFKTAQTDTFGVFRHAIYRCLYSVMIYLAQKVAGFYKIYI